MLIGHVSKQTTPKAAVGTRCDPRGLKRASKISLLRRTLSRRSTSSTNERRQASANWASSCCRHDATAECQPRTTLGTQLGMDFAIAACPLQHALCRPQQLLVLATMPTDQPLCCATFAISPCRYTNRPWAWNTTGTPHHHLPLRHDHARCRVAPRVLWFVMTENEALPEAQETISASGVGTFPSAPGSARRT